MEASLAKMSIPMLRSFIQVRRRSCRSRATRPLHIAALPFSPPLPGNQKQTHARARAHTHTRVQTHARTHNTHVVCCFESHRRHPSLSPPPTPRLKKRLLLQPLGGALCSVRSGEESASGKTENGRSGGDFSCASSRLPLRSRSGQRQRQQQQQRWVLGKVRVERRTHLGGENLHPLAVERGIARRPPGSFCDW